MELKMEVKMEVMSFAQDKSIAVGSIRPRAKRVNFHERSELTSTFTSPLTPDFILTLQNQSNVHSFSPLGSRAP